MKIGLVLEGGAMKGLYSAGVLDALMEKDINITNIVGVSAGALFGVNYKSKQKERAIRYNLKYCSNKNYMGLYSLLKTGDIMGKDFCFNEMVYKLDPFDFKTFKEDPIDFTCVVTSTTKGIAKYVKLIDLAINDQMEYLRASGSMPFVSKMVKIEDDYYLDGALKDSIPLNYLEQLNLDKIIVILTKEKGYRKHKRNNFFTNLYYRKYPNLKKAINERYIMYNKQIEDVEEKELNKKIFVLRPSKHIKVKRLEKNKEVLKAIYNLGFTDLNDNIKALYEYLEK